MKAPLLKVVAAGDFSPWAKQLLNSLQEQEIIETHFSPNIDELCRSLVPDVRPYVCAIENNSESRNNIAKLCGLGRPLYVIWIGKVFSKEDLMFAFEQRIYAIFDAVKLDEKSVISRLKTLSQLVDSESQVAQIVRAMKSNLLQIEAEFPEISMVAELRTAVRKLENHGFKNELNHMDSQGVEESLENLFHKGQSLGEAIISISELERTGVLWVRGAGADQEGKIDFIQGKMTEATSGSCEGKKAIYRMFLWQKPRLLFYRKDPSEALIAKHIDMDVSQLVKVGTLYHDKFEQLKAEIPPPALRLELNPGVVKTDIALTDKEFSTLSSVVEFGTVSNVVDFNDLPDVDIYESLISLRKNNLIQVASP